MADKKILFVLPYPLGYAPSQRFRVEAFFPVLRDAGINFDTHCFFTERAWHILYKKGHLAHKAVAVIAGFLRRLFLLLRVHRYEYVFVHREATPIGPPFFEWTVAKLLRKKMIYDFDDAIWIPNTSAENKIVSWFKAFWKVKLICKWSYKVVGGNDFLCAFAAKYNEKTVRIPTCVDVEKRHNQIKTMHPNKPVVGWTGSHSTLLYLDDIVPVIATLQEKFSFTFLVISNQKPQLQLKDWAFLPWREETEVEDLLKMDIGIMPLKADAWSEGKCGFKLIQYFAMGLPAVASPIGVNTVIVDEGVSGFLCTTPEEWLEVLGRLLTDTGLRTSMGLAGRKKVVKHYSIQSQASRFENLFS